MASIFSCQQSHLARGQGHCLGDFAAELPDGRVSGHIDGFRRAGFGKILSAIGRPRGEGHCEPRSRHHM